MGQQKNRFIQSLFTFLKQEKSKAKGSRYVLLKWLGNDLMQLPEGSDLDILIDQPLEAKIIQHIYANRDIQKIRKEKRAGVHHYYLYFQDDDFLQIDLLFQLSRKNLVYLPTEEVFQKSIDINGIAACYPAIVLEHALLFNYLNKSGLPKKYVAHFQTLSKTKNNQIIKSINQKYGTSFSNLKALTKFEEKERIKFVQYLKTLPENNFFQQLKQGWHYFKSTLINLKKSRGKIITFSGVDGAGKSTIINDTQKLLGKKYRQKVILLRHRPSILPIISAWKYGKATAEKKSVSQLPRQGKNSSKLSSYLRFGYYYLDYLLGQFYIWARYVVWGYIVLYDRYYFDFIVDGKRSNISLSQTVPKKLYQLIKKPDLNFFLYADTATILKRKQELSAPVIESLTNGYRSLFQELSQKHKGLYLNIENIDRQKTLYTILEHYLKIV